MKTYIAQLSMGHDQMRFEGLDKSDKVHSLESATYILHVNIPSMGAAWIQQL